MKKPVIIIGAVIVVAIIGGAWLFMSKPQSSSETPSSGSSTSGNATTPSTSPTETVQSGQVALSMKNTAFSQPSITVKKGTKVTWTNEDTVRHNVVADTSQTGGLPTDNNLIGKGETYSFTFNTVGTFTYHCTPHPFMTGMVEVVE
jgi:amicyanin